MDEKAVVFKKLQKTNRYDQGIITFHARDGKLIDLDKLHESIWATRLSRRTNSGIVELQVTALGGLVESDAGIHLAVAGSDAKFALGAGTDPDVFARLRSRAVGLGTVRISGIVADYRGRWPSVMKEQPVKPRRILVTEFETAE